MQSCFYLVCVEIFDDNNLIHSVIDHFLLFPIYVSVCTDLLHVLTVPIINLSQKSVRIHISHHLESVPILTR